jgi:hypothetical protein
MIKLTKIKVTREIDEIEREFSSVAEADAGILQDSWKFPRDSYVKHYLVFTWEDGRTYPLRVDAYNKLFSLPITNTILDLKAYKGELKESPKLFDDYEGFADISV